MSDALPRNTDFLGMPAPEPTRNPGIAPDEATATGGIASGNATATAGGATDEAVAEAWPSRPDAPALGSDVPSSPWSPWLGWYRQVNGSDGPDRLVGSLYYENISAGAGADTVWGLDGAESVTGGDGADILIGGAGDATLFGGAGTDLLFAGDGIGYLNGGEGADTLVGGGMGSLEGGRGDDLIFASEGWSTYAFSPGDGQDTIIGFDPLHDTLSFANSFAEVTIAAIGGDRAQVTFRDAAGGLLDDSILLQGAVLPDGQLGLFTVWVNGGRLVLQAEQGVLQAPNGRYHVQALELNGVEQTDAESELSFGPYSYFFSGTASVSVSTPPLLAPGPISLGAGSTLTLAGTSSTTVVTLSATSTDIL